MNKLNDTSSANLKVLGESELSQVVGGRGQHRRGGGHQNQGARRNGNGGQQSSLQAILSQLRGAHIENLTINVLG